MFDAADLAVFVDPDMPGYVSAMIDGQPVAGLSNSVRLTTPDGTSWRYEYDAMGRRIRRLRVLDGGKKPAPRAREADDWSLPDDAMSAPSAAPSPEPESASRCRSAIIRSSFSNTALKETSLRRFRMSRAFRGVPGRSTGLIWTRMVSLAVLSSISGVIVGLPE